MNRKDDPKSRHTQLTPATGQSLICVWSDVTGHWRLRHCSYSGAVILGVLISARMPTRTTLSAVNARATYAVVVGDVLA